MSPMIHNKLGHQPDLLYTIVENYSADGPSSNSNYILSLFPNKAEFYGKKFTKYDQV
ncbi:hypothetical protein RCG24_19100 [Neobacillus sp. OS1-32]|uniref:hypothetical protein n=1 Tax=Neobacillus sp. OS1-32 TaxID=3070682 RepID=UPI0027E1FD05|nr:hypothetical protein [Neobacillus sp. OS1-32]WML29985.1 hypothetical protein RCG24_19100 [Neobacillus sp. OS1-32]